MEEKQNRFESWALWVAVAALIGFIIKKTTGYDPGPIINELLDLLLPVLVGFGIINNPTDKAHL